MTEVEKQRRKAQLIREIAKELMKQDQEEGRKDENK